MQDESAEGSGAVPRKRPRLDDTAQSPKLSAACPDHVIRDEKFYFEDGSCVLQVENTLFNVHRTILSADNSTFGGLFMLPLGSDKVPEGTTDNNPILLMGDSPSAFRNFLWALYSLPHELSIVHTQQADITRLIDIAHIANKYSFKTTEIWALDAVQDYINQKPSQNMSTTGSDVYLAGTQTLSATQMMRLVRLAQMCSHPSLLTTLMNLLKTLLSVSSEWAYLVLSLADELNLTALRGAAYLEVMQKDRVVLRRSDAGVVAGDIDSEGRLIVTQTQQLRLLSGYYWLTTTWEHLRSQPPHFEHAIGCGATWHKHGCSQAWLEFWRSTAKCDSVLGHGLADVIGRLRTVIRMFDKWGTVPHMHYECRIAARRAIVEKANEIESQLSDIFGDDTDEIRSMDVQGVTNQLL